MRFNVLSILFILTLFSGAVSANSFPASEDDKPVVLTEDVQDSNTLFISWSEAKKECKITLTSNILGQSVSVSATGETCAEAAQILREGFEEAIRAIENLRGKLD